MKIKLDNYIQQCLHSCALLVQAPLHCQKKLSASTSALLVLALAT